MKERRNGRRTIILILAMIIAMAGVSALASADASPGPEFCSTITTGVGRGTAEYEQSICGEHRAIAEGVSALLSEAETPEEQEATWQAAVDLWQDALTAEYDALLADADDKEREAIEAERERFAAQLSAHEEALRADPPRGQTPTARRIAEEVQKRVMELCYARHTAPDARTDSRAGALNELPAGKWVVRCRYETEDGLVRETLCDHHRATESRVNRALDGAAPDAMAEAWRKGKELWLEALEYQANERVRLARAEAREAITGEYETFLEWLSAREALLNLLYPEDAEIVQETLAECVRGRVLALCGSVKDIAPTLKEFNAALSADGEGESTVSGNVLEGSALGNGTASEHTFAWGDEAARYGTMTKNEDGTFTYTMDKENAEVRALSDGDTLTESFTYTYTDNECDKTGGTLTITISGTDEAPTVQSFTGDVTEDDASQNQVTGNALEGAALGDGTAEQHTFAWGDEEAKYGTMTKGDDGAFTYTLDNDNADVQALNTGESLQEDFTYTYTDKDGSAAQGSVSITIYGADEPMTITVSEEELILELTDGSGDSTVTVPAGFSIAGSTGDVTETYRMVPPQSSSMKVLIDGSQYDVPLLLNDDESAWSGRVGPVTAFSVSVSGDGNVSLFMQEGITLVHPDSGADVYEINGLAVECVAVDEGGNRASAVQDHIVLRLTDDTPDFTGEVRASDIEQMNVDETYFADSTTTPTDTATVDMTAALEAKVNYGADGKGKANEYAFSFSEEGADSVKTGLFAIDGDGAKGDEILLYKDSGSCGLYGATKKDGERLFTLGMSDDAKLTFTLKKAIWHDDGSDANDVKRLDGIASRKLSLDCTIYDADGDSAVLRVDMHEIGSQIYIYDDAPEAQGDEASIAEGAAEAAEGNVLDNDHYGADGPHAESALAWAESKAQYGAMTLNEDGAFSYAPDNENPAVRALGEGDTLEETFGYTITDADGDTAAGKLTVTITGANSKPVVYSASIELQEDGPDLSSARINVLEEAVPGDGTAEQHTLAWGDEEAKYGTATKGDDGVFTYALDNDNAGVQALNKGEFLEEKLTYTYTDKDGSAATGSVSIIIKGVNEPLTVTANGDLSLQLTESLSGASISGLADFTVTGGTGSVTKAYTLEGGGFTGQKALIGGYLYAVTEMLNSDLTVCTVAANDQTILRISVDESGKVTFEMPGNGTLEHKNGSDIRATGLSVVCTATDEDGKTASASQGLSLAVADAKPSISGPTEDLAVDIGINGQFIFDFGADGPSERIVYFTAPCEATLYLDDEKGSVFFDDNELEMWFYSSGWYTAEQDITTKGWHTFIFYIVDADGSEAEHKIVVETWEIG